MLGINEKDLEEALRVIEDQTIEPAFPKLEESTKKLEEALV